MKYFAWAYTKTLRWSEHPAAVSILFAVSFSESIFFPIPPDCLLIPMAMSKPSLAWRLAALTTLGSVLGALVGYVLGAYLMQQIMPWLDHLGYAVRYAEIQHWFLTYGFWAVLLAGFTPIPFKLVTLASGAAHLPLLPFVLGSLISRGGRFYLEASLLHRWGSQIRASLYDWIDYLGWFLIMLFAAWYVADQISQGVK